MKHFTLTFLLFASCLSSPIFGLAFQPGDSIKTALLIVDIQAFYFPGEGLGLENAVQAGLNAGRVLGVFRDKKQTVVHVRHQAKKGFDFYHTVLPIEGEKVITKTEVNSFYNTDLLQYLKVQHINRLVIIGMQTHMCLEAAVRAGHDYGFECVVIADACATRDLKYGESLVKAADVHASTLATLANGGYARVISLDQFLSAPDNFIFSAL